MQLMLFPVCMMFWMLLSLLTETICKKSVCVCVQQSVLLVRLVAVCLYVAELFWIF